MKITLLTLVGLFILSACAQVDSPLSPSVAVENPTSTKSVMTRTPIPSRTSFPSQTSYPTPTEWIKVYPTKKALVIYGTSWRNQYTLNFIMWGDFYLEPYLVLYEDGQLIFGLGDKQKQLSQQDTEAILAKLEELGFFQLQNTYAADKENPLYNFPNKIMPDANLNLPSVIVTVNGQEIRYMKEWENYLIPPMKDIISYLKSLSDVGAAPYRPERLLVAAGEVEQIPNGATVIPWPENIPSPIRIFYLEGNEALKLYQAAGENLGGYFSYEGKNYDVYLRPILPHECHIYHYSKVNLPPTAQTPFTCDDW
jgi:hypothetical protein